ncbi:MAG: hypothetical protein CVV64_01675 [Candidatus Wallbacteria bacterium HGW-Wallbacteria-1]|jgi:hypothetical protein|uniref:Poly A polymerase head domain-containing protein n=1 Tax=Candidatus Wallbacteria bacterium HGW-Wallbacteria-1 TaxID=2013854 RepID=A0A2N1PUY7_9BACT|nr:MAG: hypothetical protein CVV64_01675 [Candidatus Wallbacteria bacterium HGW-Wallbacteria-1]
MRPITGNRFSVLKNIDEQPNEGFAEMISRLSLLAFALILVPILSLSAAMAFQINLSGYPEISELFRISEQYNSRISLFGGTSRDVILGNKIHSHDQFDILLPPDYIEGELNLEQREFIRKITSAAGGQKRLHLIYSKGRESFNKLYAIGGLSINKVVITSDGTVIDRHGGLSDAQRRLLRHIPGVDSYWPSFLPLFDVLRGIRFLTQYRDFNLDPATANYYRKAVSTAANDSEMLRRILAIFKNVAEGQPHARDFPGDSKEFITTKVQIREIKSRLDKIFLFSEHPERSEKLLADFGVMDFLKKIHWPEKDYVVARMDLEKLRGKYGLTVEPKGSTIKTNTLASTNTPRQRSTVSATAARSDRKPHNDNTDFAMGLGIPGGNQVTTENQQMASSDTYAETSNSSGNDSTWPEDDEMVADSSAAAPVEEARVEGETNGSDMAESASDGGQDGGFQDPFEDINFEDFNLDDF